MALPLVSPLHRGELVRGRFLPGWGVRPLWKHSCTEATAKVISQASLVDGGLESHVEQEPWAGEAACPSGPGLQPGMGSHSVSSPSSPGRPSSPDVLCHLEPSAHGSSGGMSKKQASLEGHSARAHGVLYSERTQALPEPPQGLKPLSMRHWPRVKPTCTSCPAPGAQLHRLAPCHLALEARESAAGPGQAYSRIRWRIHHSHKRSVPGQSCPPGGCQTSKQRGDITSGRCCNREGEG